MANVFKNSVTGSIGLTNTNVYQVPAATTTTIIGVNDILQCSLSQVMW
jgi:hypothetical protein